MPEFQCSSEEDLRRHAETFAASLGFATYGFVAELRPTDSSNADPLLFVGNAAPAWEASIRESLASGLPHNLVRHATLQLPPVGWNGTGELSGHTIIDELALEHVRSMREWPVHAGTLCTVFAPELSWGAMAFFSARAMTVAELDRVLPACSLYALNFCFWYLQSVHRRQQARRTLLSRRETQCLGQAALGHTSAEIGTGLGISARTVEGYIASACAKLNCRGRQAAIARAHELNLLSAWSELRSGFERQRDDASRERTPALNLSP